MVSWIGCFAETTAIVSFFWALGFYFENVPPLPPMKFVVMLLFLLAFKFVLPFAACYWLNKLICCCVLALLVWA